MAIVGIGVGLGEYILSIFASLTNISCSFCLAIKALTLGKERSARIDYLLFYVCCILMVFIINEYN
jgi:hypothetical protein